ncbi:putative ATP-dependent endonuclease of OLD family [Phyllobacterium myrsinacearum]|uniref:Putative ATP-dependent endonuclease of OLD family n=1 Tax=Phyllobacterium myrsinacearum TaxID=28101 RepID=A0A839ETA4_9HYPH|nr:putative ATP-dependent endonuclease of OLD family [Phyllobacterium myrsinacearum]
MRLSKFKITNYRNILDSGWINTTNVTAFVGQNEAGKSNLFEALYCLNPYVDGARYNDAEDWPVDDWGGRSQAKGKRVCEAIFSLDSEDIRKRRLRPIGLAIF